MEGRVGIYSVKPTKKTWLPESSDGNVLFSGTKKVLVPEFSIRNRQWITGLTAEEARALEGELGLKLNELSPNNKEYWGNFRIPISKGGEVLDISKPQDFLIYKVLKASSLVATSKEEMTGEKGLFAEVLMMSDAKEVEGESKKVQLELDAIDAYRQMSLSDYVDFLMVAFPSKSLTISDKHNPDFLRTEVYKVVKNKPKEFLTLINDKYYKGKIMIEKCIAMGAIEKNGTRYYLAGDSEPFAHNLVNAVDYVYDPKNQAVLVSLTSKLATA